MQRSRNSDVIHDGADKEENEDDDREKARQVLMSRLADLRPVAFRDFSMAIDFIVGQTPPEQPDDILSPNTRNALPPGPRYDTSSSESDHDDGNNDGEEEEEEEEGKEDTKAATGETPIQEMQRGSL